MQKEPTFTYIPHALGMISFLPEKSKQAIVTLVVYNQFS